MTASDEQVEFETYDDLRRFLFEKASSDSFSGLLPFEPDNTLIIETREVGRQWRYAVTAKPAERMSLFISHLQKDGFIDRDFILRTPAILAAKEREQRRQSRTEANAEPSLSPQRDKLRWDVFVSYASEDKEAAARPLVERLCSAGLSVWWDELCLQVGDSLRRKIDQGLAASRYGIVILSPRFFDKHFTNLELDGLAQREVSGEKIILPVWYEVTADDVRGYSLTLADRIAADWSEGLDTVVSKLLAVIRRCSTPSAPDNPPEGPLEGAAMLESEFAKCRRMMPELLAEMRADLTKHPLVREFILLKRRWVYNPDPNKTVFVYYFDEHPGLSNKVELLENCGLVCDIAFNEVQRYLFTEQFVELLQRHDEARRSEVQAKLSREIEKLALADIGLQDVLQCLREYSDANILVDWRALIEAGIERSTKVSLDARGITVRTVLGRLVQDLDSIMPPEVGMTYVVGDDHVRVTTTVALAREKRSSEKTQDDSAGQPN